MLVNTSTGLNLYTRKIVTLIPNLGRPSRVTLRFVAYFVLFTLSCSRFIAAKEQTGNPDKNSDKLNEVKLLRRELTTLLEAQKGIVQQLEEIKKFIFEIFRRRTIAEGPVVEGGRATEVCGDLATREVVG